VVYAIYHTHTFDRSLDRMPKDFQEWLTKVENQLVENPFVGDQIRVPCFREKKKDKQRVYYLIYEELQIVYVVGMSSKKNQRAVINAIWLLLDNFKEEIKQLVHK